MTNVLKKYNTDEKIRNGPDVTETDNNGLMWTADVLEEIYTNPDFPSGAPKLEVSMKESGKSRADLWAFAGLLAVYIGIEENNLACNGTPRSKIALLRTANMYMIEI